LRRLDDTRLRQLIDPRGARIIELRFFSALTIDETAEVLDISPGTVKRDWSAARAWLYREMRQPLSE
jgi:RNA polymerase sigma factor (sigma-70 family)